MGGGIIGKFISFWAFIIGVLCFGWVFGKVFGFDFFSDGKTTVVVLIAAAIVFVVWTVGRSKAAKRREEREWQAQQERINKRKGKGNKRR